MSQVGVGQRENTRKRSHTSLHLEGISQFENIFSFFGASNKCLIQFIIELNKIFQMNFAVWSKILFFFNNVKQIVLSND